MGVGFGKTTTMLLLILLSAISALGARVLLPELTGPYGVGLRNIELVDDGRPDPFSPSGAPRDLMVTLFYPTASASSSSFNFPLAPQFSPATASHVDGVFSWTPGTAASLTTRARLGARPLAADAGAGAAPVLLFSHGFGFARGLYAALLQDLASWGWTVAAVDHPYDAAVVEYPDGRVVRARGWRWPLEPAVRELAIDVRVADLLFVLGRLESGLQGRERMAWGEIRPGENDELITAVNVSRVAALGHSFGGAAAVGTLLNSSAVVAAADLDGFLYGPVVRLGTEKPVLVLGFPEHVATDDPTAAPGWPSLHGWKRDFTVAGTVHESYSDYPVFRDIFGGREGPETGGVPGTRMAEIMRTYIDAFFSRFLLGVDDDGFLSGNSSTFPEVTLRRGGGVSEKLRVKTTDASTDTKDLEIVVNVSQPRALS
ncbi:hypothetical protein GGS23DRAFT_616753 [Durotheca rogersii]|uniref:uncharacterized protein n=1 Tax=Durotheca rogersii TaxID=419775 RepID=UPI00221F9DD4|nr:uncharacterized protein GGS23DRAFT_616753 [Durotheca rogersii]KAI5857394.1 hypothetical protein GGS23DRAFT_616753 [Durotheca rogersii]